MPMFYIGRSNVERVANGYHGSVSSKLYKDIWTKELEQNPNLFETKILTTHTTKQEAAQQEEYFHKKYQVHKNPMYINQATGSGTFHSDISGKKNPFYGKSRAGELNPMFNRKHKDSSKAKMSSSGKGKHSQPKTEEFKQKMRDLYAGKTFEERFGVEYAAEILAKQRYPKSIEHIQKIKDNPYHANRPKLRCPHCQEEVSASNLKRWHGDNCKMNPTSNLDNRKANFEKNNPSQLKKVCPHCGTLAGGSLFSRWHGDNCKLFKIVSDPR
jgi:hypothetical protein